MITNNQQIKDGLDSMISEANFYEWNFDKCILIVDPRIEDIVKSHVKHITIVSSAVISKNSASLRNENGNELNFTFII